VATKLILWLGHFFGLYSSKLKCLKNAPAIFSENSLKHELILVIFDMQNREGFWQDKICEFVHLRCLVKCWMHCSFGHIV